MNIVEQIQSFLNAEEKDWNEGATLVLQTTMNRILYRNISRCPEKFADVITVKLQDWLKFKINESQREQVKVMREEAKKIITKRHLDSNKKEKGKRTDHDELPEDIQMLYKENFSIVQRMRECHLQLVNIAQSNTTCLDADQFPFLEELIKLDKKLRDNWKKYDSYGIEPVDAVAKEIDEKEAKALKMISLYKGKYKKNPSPQIKEKILSYLKEIKNPSDKLNEELKQLNIL